jgi:hypothetical protein
MRTVVLVAASILFGMLGCTPNQSEELNRLRAENAELKALLGPPPRSLDGLFPPAVARPVYLARMFEMATPLAAVGIAVSNGDLEQGKQHFEQFTMQYMQVSSLVPEWESTFPVDPVEELEAALDAGDPGEVMVALEVVNSVCQTLHHASLVDPLRVEGGVR